MQKQTERTDKMNLDNQMQQLLCYAAVRRALTERGARI